MNRIDLFHQAYRESWAKAKAKDAFEPKVLVRYKREHDLAVWVWKQQLPALLDLRVVSMVKLGNDETDETKDKPHGSSHSISLRPQADHSFHQYKPKRRLASYKE